MDNESTKVATGAEQDNNSENKSESTPKTYTQEEVDKLLQQEGDRRVSSALAKQQKKFEAEKAEADKLREMDENQRKEYEYEKRLRELEDREKEFNLTQNKLSASKVLAERNLPIQFVDYIVAEDAETMMTNITEFEKAWKAAVADAVNARLAAPAPKGASVSQNGMTKESFKKLNLQQQAALYNSNPELYKQMTA